MNNTLRFRSILTLVATLFLAIGVNAQTGMNNSKKKSSKTEQKAKENSNSEAQAAGEDEEVEYYYSYVVVELTEKDKMYTVSMDKSVFEGSLKLPEDQMQIAKKAASGGLQYRSETEFLNFMASSNYELVTVSEVADQKGKKSKMYFRIKLER